MAVIKQDFNVMYLPAAIQRNNPIPLDSTAVWYDYEKMAAYAASDPTAYVGQILSLIVNNEAKAYIISNLAGDLEEVGSAIITDNKTIVLNNGALAFKDFGKRYYRYDAETEEYIIQEVDETHPWIAGLEPKVTSEAGQLVLGWFEPNSTTVEGINSALSTLQTSVNDLQGNVSGLSVRMDGLSDSLANVYTKEETLAEIAKAEHLAYKKVDSIDDIDTSDSKTIYLVPALEGLAEDLYDEYMVIDGVIERLGSWEVNLNNYATKDDLSKKVDKVDGYDLISVTNIGKLDTIEEGAEKNYISEVDEGLNVANGKLSIVSLPSSVNLASHTAILELNTKLNSKVSVVSGKSLVDDTLISKLQALDGEAEKNVVNAVDESEFALDLDRKLSLRSVSGSKIIDLNLNTDFSALSNKVNSIQTDLAELNTSIQALDVNLSAYKVEVAQKYLTIEDFEKYFTWHDLGEQE